MFDAVVEALGTRDDEEAERVGAVQALYEAGGEAAGRGGVKTLVEAVDVSGLATAVTLDGLAAWERARWEAAEAAEERGEEPEVGWEGDGPWMFPLLQQCLGLLARRVHVQARRSVRMLEMNERLAEEVEILAAEAERNRAEAVRYKARLRELGGFDVVANAVQTARHAITVQRWYRGHQARKRVAAARSSAVRERRSLVSTTPSTKNKRGLKMLPRSQSLSVGGNPPLKGKVGLSPSARTSSAPLALRQTNATADF